MVWWCLALKRFVRMMVILSLVAGKGLPVKKSIFLVNLQNWVLSMHGWNSSQYVPFSLVVHARSTGGLMKQFPPLSFEPWALLPWLALCNAIWKNHLKFLYPPVIRKPWKRYRNDQNSPWRTWCFRDKK